MAKRNQLTSLPFKGLKTTAANQAYQFAGSITLQPAQKASTSELENRLTNRPLQSASALDKCHFTPSEVTSHENVICLNAFRWKMRIFQTVTE